MICIYCLQDKGKSNFKKREHVIPQSFGKFPSDNLVLHEIVCDECNQYFGDHLELYLGRDSYEGFSRLMHGIKSKKPLKRRKRILNKISKGQFKGVIVRERSLSENGSYNSERVPQVGIFNGLKQEYEFFEIGQIPNLDYLLENGFQLRNEMLRIIANDIEHKQIVEELEQKGININPDIALMEDEPDDTTIQVEGEIIIDKTIMRCLCKIAFNYLASLVGKNFVMSESFDSIRHFIRRGEGKQDDFVLVNQPSILFEDQQLDKLGFKVTRGHLIMVEWIGQKLYSKLSLFNELTYGINLCKNYKGIWIPIKGGHLFDVDNSKIRRLKAIRKELAP